MAITSPEIRSKQSRIVADNPDWERSGSDKAPSGPNDGLNLGQALKTSVQVSCRLSPGFKTVILNVEGELFPMASYDVQIDSDTVSFVGTPVTVRDVAQGVVDALNASVPVSAKVTAILVLGPSEDDPHQIRIEGKTETNYAVTTDISGVDYPDTVFEIQHEDASEADIEIYLLAGGEGDRPTSWAKANMGSFTVREEGYIERFVTAGFARMALKITVIGSGSVTSWIGPARN